MTKPFCFTWASIELDAVGDHLGSKRLLAELLDESGHMRRTIMPITWCVYPRAGRTS